MEVEKSNNEVYNSEIMPVPDTKKTHTNAIYPLKKDLDMTVKHNRIDSMPIPNIQVKAKSVAPTKSEKMKMSIETHNPDPSYHELIKQ